MTNIQKIQQGAYFSLTNYPERVFRIKDNTAQFWSGGIWVAIVEYNVEFFSDRILFTYAVDITIKIILREDRIAIFE